MKLKIIGNTIDLRTNTPVVYAQIGISDYLELVGINFDDFSIQRRREKYKAYERMKADIKKGALLPSITLALKPEIVDSYLPLIEKWDIQQLELKLCESGIVNILDGLQRTYTLFEIKNEKKEFLEGQTLLLEFWFESNIRNLIYRIIVLNAGQKPMTMRHQIEVLFHNVKGIIEKKIPDLEIYTEKDESRRSRPKKYPMERIISSYQSFLYKSPEILKENIIAQQLADELAFQADEDELGEKFEEYVNYLQIYASLDEAVCGIYPANRGSTLPSGVAWFGSENVMDSFFAAISDFGSSPERKKRILSATNILLISLQKSTVGSDPLGLSTLQKIIEGFPVRKQNVGVATRKLLTSAFKEYFREEGSKKLSDCWLAEA